MPGGNRMGPRDEGPMTGRGAGYCRGYDTPGLANPDQLGRFGRGRGWGRQGGGGGLGWRHGRGLTQPLIAPAPSQLQTPAQPEQPAPSASNELDLLKRLAVGLEQTVRELKARLDHLEAAGQPRAPEAKEER